MQPDGVATGNEDCLHLNVYAPLANASAPLWPVYVFIHGGAWMTGTGTVPIYGPDFLLDNHDVVLVTFNYRVGILGFLSSEQEDCPGNFGLKDQVEVLRWVHANIWSFGGDPALVTLVGQSAGAASVTYHMQSPLSRGLFHRAIAMSGVNLNSFAQPAHIGVAARKTIKLARILGCGNLMNNWRQTIQCFRRLPAEKITSAAMHFYVSSNSTLSSHHNLTRNASFQMWEMEPMSPFTPVIEPDSPDAFITKHPRHVQQPHGLSIPLMVGVTADEGLLKSAGMQKSDLNFASDTVLFSIVQRSGSEGKFE